MPHVVFAIGPRPLPVHPPSESLSPFPASRERVLSLIPLQLKRRLLLLSPLLVSQIKSFR